MKTYSLLNIPSKIHSKVGGKARGLYQLNCFGFNVPQGFIVTDIKKDDDYAEALKRYEEMGSPVVAARSSATLEDGDDFSSAGQYDTILNVQGGDNLVEAIKSCVGSLYNTTASRYMKIFFRARNKEMTVVVQKMIDSKFAGVIFTRHPSDKDAILIEAVDGLGENLVSGKKSAQQYVVKGTEIDAPKNPILTREQVLALADGAQKAEQSFQRPMDLEWAIDSNGELFWLQARPITIGDTPTIDELDYQDDVTNNVITTGNVGEMMPGAVTPLNVSTNVYALDWGVRKIMNKIGVTSNVDDLPPFSVISTYSNHLFFNMSNMYRICRAIIGSTKASMDVSICGRVLEDYPDITMKNKLGIIRLYNTFRFVNYITNGKGAKKGSDKIASKIKFDLSKDMYSIYDQIIKNFKYLKAAQFYHYWASMYSGAQCNTLFLSLNRFYPDKTTFHGILSGALTEIDNIESADILKSMRRLARTILADNADAGSYTSEQLEEYMENSASKEVRDEYDKFMERHGHRGIREAEISILSWSDDHKSFYDSLRSVLASGGEDVQTTGKHWQEYADELLSPCISKIQKAFLYDTIKRARKGVYYREYTKSRDIYVLSKFKSAYRVLGEQMAKKGMIVDSNIIYFLTQDEVGELLRGNQAIIKKAIARRRLYKQQMALKFPDFSLGKPVAMVPKSSNPNATKYMGTPASRGVATGRARVVNSIDDANKLEQGDIMIAGFTDIGWSPYYSIIGGLITEIGSSLSHGIVVAREYALPSIVNVDNAMRDIHTGDIITMDGGTGEVTIVERAK